VSEARAFAAGYAAAIKALKLKSPYSSCAIQALEQSLDEIPNLFEYWQLSQDPEFQESLEQMKRGEGREINLDELGP